MNNKNTVKHSDVNVSANIVEAQPASAEEAKLEQGEKNYQRLFHLPESATPIMSDQKKILFSTLGDRIEVAGKTGLKRNLRYNFEIIPKTDYNTTRVTLLGVEWHQDKQQARVFFNDDIQKRILDNMAQSIKDDNAMQGRSNVAEIMEATNEAWKQIFREIAPDELLRPYRQQLLNDKKAVSERCNRERKHPNRQYPIAPQEKSLDINERVQRLLQKCSMEFAQQNTAPYMREQLDRVKNLGALLAQNEYRATRGHENFNYIDAVRFGDASECQRIINIINAPLRERHRRGYDLDQQEMTPDEMLHDYIFHKIHQDLPDEIRADLEQKDNDGINRVYNQDAKKYISSIEKLLREELIAYCNQAKKYYQSEDYIRFAEEEAWYSKAVIRERERAEKRRLTKEDEEQRPERMKQDIESIISEIENEICSFVDRGSADTTTTCCIFPNGVLSQSINKEDEIRCIPMSPLDKEFQEKIDVRNEKLHVKTIDQATLQAIWQKTWRQYWTEYSSVLNRFGIEAVQQELDLVGLSKEENRAAKIETQYPNIKMESAFLNKETGELGAMLTAADYDLLEKGILPYYGRDFISSIVVDDPLNDVFNHYLRSQAQQARKEQANYFSIEQQKNIINTIIYGRYKKNELFSRGQLNMFIARHIGAEKKGGEKLLNLLAHSVALDMYQRISTEEIANFNQLQGKKMELPASFVYRYTGKMPTTEKQCTGALSRLLFCSEFTQYVSGADMSTEMKSFFERVAAEMSKQ